MIDSTENVRRVLCVSLNSEVESNDKDSERERLEKIYGQVWNTEELSRDFIAIAFMAPFITVRRKEDNKKGILMFQDQPRFYFDWRES